MQDLRSKAGILEWEKSRGFIDTSTGKPAYQLESRSGVSGRERKRDGRLMAFLHRHAMFFLGLGIRYYEDKRWSTKHLVDCNYAILIGEEEIEMAVGTVTLAVLAPATEEQVTAVLYDWVQDNHVLWDHNDQPTLRLCAFTKRAEFQG